jgi:hypothetical protein
MREVSRDTREVRIKFLLDLVDGAKYESRHSDFGDAAFRSDSTAVVNDMRVPCSQ